ncbi:MAG: hypothetical protein F4103_16490 [Boseongicola sp. SB0673_bin_14]|nr:hypothetical protein [Boseongicola sp. SB0673_bin_14]
MVRHLEFAARTKVLAVTLACGLTLAFAVFPNLPIGGPSIDSQPGYDLDRLTVLMEMYGERGRRVHAWASLTLDVLFPVVYATFLAGLVWRCRPARILGWLALLPVAGALFDLVENVQVAAMLFRYPEIGEGQAALASAFTAMKWNVLTATLVVAAAFAAWAAGRLVLDRMCRM